MKSTIRVGLAAVIAALFVGGSALAGFAQCPCSINCPAGDGGVTAPAPPGGYKTPDLDGNGSVNLVDLAIFAGAWPPGSYLFCADYDCNGVLNLVDLVYFAGHWLHSGPVPGYNAPGIDHYKIYETVGPPHLGPFRLRDQFWEINIDGAKLDKFATPVSKNHEGICDSLAHQSWWEIFHPAPMWVVEAEDQFGSHEWTLGEPRYLVLPALKNEGVGSQLPEYNHYLCYEAQGPTIDHEVLLVDQFDQVHVVVMEGKYFCNPCEKETPDGVVYPIVDPSAHMTVYFVENPIPYDIQALMQDQFIEEVIMLHNNRYLAVPALKKRVVSYDLIPPTVTVPSGNFTMGDGAANCGVDEHQVTLTRAFRLGQHEVTNQEFIAGLQWAYDEGYVTATEDSVLDALDGSTVKLLDMANEYCEIQFSGGVFSLRESSSMMAQTAYPNGYDPGPHPVKMVTWYGSARFCDWLSLHAGLPRAYQHQGDWSCNGGDPYGAQGYRLPTNAEWEYAAQFDNERIYPWGNDVPDCTRANYAEDSVTVCVGWTTPVGTYPNAPAKLGLSDMAGNMAEMGNDWFRCNLGVVPRTDPVGPPTGDGRVQMAGCSFWIQCCTSYGVNKLKVAGRGMVDEGRSEFYVGFRIARTVNQ